MRLTVSLTGDDVGNVLVRTGREQPRRVCGQSSNTDERLPFFTSFQLLIRIDYNIQVDTQ